MTSAYIDVNWSNMTNFGDFLTKANQSGGGGVFAGIDILVFAVILVSVASMAGSWEIGLLTAGFIALIIA